MCPWWGGYKALTRSPSMYEPNCSVAARRFPPAPGKGRFIEEFSPSEGRRGSLVSVQLLLGQRGQTGRGGFELPGKGTLKTSSPLVAECPSSTAFGLDNLSHAGASRHLSR